MPISTCIFVNPTYFGLGFQLFFSLRNCYIFYLDLGRIRRLKSHILKKILLLISVDFHTDRCLNWELQCLMSSTIISLHTSVGAKTNLNFERKCMKIVCVLYCNYFMSMHLLFSKTFLTLDQIELNLIEMLLERFSTLCVIFVLHCIWKFCKATWSNYAFWLANISTIFPELLLVLYMTIFLLLLCINWQSEIPDDHHYKTSLTYEWVSDCCLTPIQQFLSYIMARTS